MLYVATVVLSYSQRTDAIVTYYVSSNGADRNKGTYEEPWKTIDKANKEVKSGDTVVVMPGKYPHPILPTKNGSDSKPITYRSQFLHQAILTGDETNYSFEIYDKHFVNIEGFRIEPERRVSKWGYVKKSNNIQIANCLMTHAVSEQPFIVSDSRYIRLTNNIFRGRHLKNMVRVGHSSRVVIEGNDFSHAAHATLQLFPDRTTSHIVMRGNTFHSVQGRNFELFSTNDVLFENNVITDSYNGTWSKDSGSKLLSERGIFRNNFVGFNSGVPLMGLSYRPTLSFKNARIYSNIFLRNRGGVLHIGGHPENVMDIKIVNNVFILNEVYDTEADIKLNRSLHDYDISIMNNLFLMREDFIGHAIVEREYDGKEWVMSEQSIGSTKILREQGNEFIQVNKVDMNTDVFYISRANEYKQDVLALTNTSRSGKGKKIPVNDSYYFYDGFDIPGEKGDTILIGEKKIKAVIVRINKKKNELLVDRSVSWRKGEKIYYDNTLATESKKIGYKVICNDNAYNEKEYVKKRGCDVGSTNNYLFWLSKGENDESITWMFDDGSYLTGDRVEKHLVGRGLKTVRVLLQKANGDRIYLGMVIRIVGSPENKNYIAMSFNSMDDEWWWRWNTGKNTKATQRAKLDGQNYLQITAMKRGAEMLVKMYLKHWDIDEYPYIRFDYKIPKNIGVAFFVEGYESAKKKYRDICLMESKITNNIGGDCLGKEYLIADNEWHEARVDARIANGMLRESRYPSAILFKIKEGFNSARGASFNISNFQISSKKTALPESK